MVYFNRYARKALAAASLVAVGLSVTATGAQAQTGPDDTLDRAESRLDRLDRFERIGPEFTRAVPDEAERLPWELSLSLPFTYNTNVANAELGEQQAFHANPTVTLAKAWSIGPTAQFFVEGNIDSDIYTSYSENDSSTLMGQTGVRLGDASTAIAPYIHYTILSLYTGQFDSHDVTIHHFTAGAKRSWTAGENARIIVDASVLRREATLRTVELNRAAASLTYLASINERTSWKISARGQYSHYTGSSSQGRDDILVRVLGGISFNLIEDRVVFDLLANVQRNWSDRPGKDYSVWDIGPTISLSTTF